MNCIKEGRLAIVFGNKNNNLRRNDLISDELAQEFMQELLVVDQGLKSLVFLNQTHGTDFRLITQSTDCSMSLDLARSDGDIIITNQPAIAIGTLTADCLPIIIYDPVHHVIAVVHAGWKGSLRGIAVKTVALMQEHFMTKPSDFMVYFGPAGQPCCYEVQQDFCTEKQDEMLKNNVLIERDKRLFFDNSRYNQLELLSAGIVSGRIIIKNNLCTICSPDFFSYRREGASAGRQPSVVWIK